MVKQRVIKEINKYIKIILNDEELKKKYTALCNKYHVGINFDNGKCKQHITIRTDTEDINTIADIIIITLLEN